jgi:hypothetical protein
MKKEKNNKEIYNEIKKKNQEEERKKWRKATFKERKLTTKEKEGNDEPMLKLWYDRMTLIRTQMSGKSFKNLYPLQEEKSIRIKINI